MQYLNIDTSQYLGNIFKFWQNRSLEKNRHFANNRSFANNLGINFDKLFHGRIEKPQETILMMAPAVLFLILIWLGFAHRLKTSPDFC